MHDERVAVSMGVSAAPIEGPTHFSQIDPLAVALWGRRWFEGGCVSSHFRSMAFEGDRLRASLRTHGPDDASVAVHKDDGTEVLVGSAHVGRHSTTMLAERLGATVTPAALHVLDRLELGARLEFPEPVLIGFDEPNGPKYPFTLREKLAVITEPHPWYTAEGAASSPWGRPILPMEMLSVLAHKAPIDWPVRTPSVGLFLDLEVRILDGPLFVGELYEGVHELVALSESRRTESYWTRTSLSNAATGILVAEVLLHAGVFKSSFMG